MADNNNPTSFDDELNQQALKYRQTRPQRLSINTPVPFDPSTNQLTCSASGYSPRNNESEKDESISNNNNEKSNTKSKEKIDRCVESPSARFAIGWADTIGKRASMEDAIKIVGEFRGRKDEEYLAVFDGHGGPDVALFASEHLHKIIKQKMDKQLDPKTEPPKEVMFKILEESFFELNEKLGSNHEKDGSTAVVAVLVGNKGYIAGAGDTRAVLATKSGAKRLSTDHKPDLPSEEKRISDAGGFVLKPIAKNGKVIARVGGILAVSRAFGDQQLSPYVTCEPEIQTFDVLSGKFLIIACDGVWDVIDDDEACNLIDSIHNPEEAAKYLRDTALTKGSLDNISVIVVRLDSSPSRPSNPSGSTSTGNKVLFYLIAALLLLFFAISYILGTY